MTLANVPREVFEGNTPIRAVQPTDNRPVAVVPLALHEHAGLTRAGEPVVTGLPLPRGLVANTSGCRIRDRRSKANFPCQAKALGSWPDGSIKWLSVTFLVDIAVHSNLDLELCCFNAVGGVEECSNRGQSGGARVRETASSIEPLAEKEVFDNSVAFWDYGRSHTVAVGNTSCTLPKFGLQLIESVRVGSQNILGDGGIRFECRNSRGHAKEVIIESTSIDDVGPLRCDLHFAGRVRRCGGLRIAGKVTVFGSHGVMRIEATLQNPGRARHSGNYWDLGDPGSVFLQGWRLKLDLSALQPRQVAWIENNSGKYYGTARLPWSICQYSSGGENWNIRNHVNRQNLVPLRMRGYRTKTNADEREGLRALPVVSLDGTVGTVTCALTEFWEKFPSAIRFDGNCLCIEFLPDDFGDVHELQGGEHITRTVWLRFDNAGEGAPRDLAWVHEPLIAEVHSAWLSASDAIPWLPNGSTPRRPELQTLLTEALNGPHNLFAKRETIDEFGWRNFGDVWADHEEAYYNGPKPIISHYNNQYDLLYGLLVQFLLTGDRRWWQLADPLARHVMDIDIYHTTRDKSTYSGGLFWHTAHYLDAATSSHRTCSKRMNGPSGGPANEHAYSAGLLLYYFLTGDCRARDTVLKLAEWIITMEDGSQHILGLLCDAPTGRASCTTHADYHGPGRGAGNAIGVLVDAWLANGSERYIGFAEDLIRRTVHPHDDVTARDLNNFEHRWSYTVYLQHLARYLLLTTGVDRPNRIREYVQASLVRYSVWMVDSDRFYFDYPEQLEYPTETWAAQELRKANVLLATSQYVDAAQRERFQRRGETMLNKAWSSLMGFTTRCYTRPIALVLQQGYIESYLVHAREDVRHVFPLDQCVAFARSTFEQQSHAVRKLAHSPLGAIRAGFRMLQPNKWRSVWRRSWLAERTRRLVCD